MRRSQSARLRNEEVPFLEAFVCAARQSFTEQSKTSSNDVTREDFVAFTHFRDLQDNLQSRFDVKEYAPKVFASIRRKVDVSDEQLIDSLSIGTPISDDKSRGRSGAAFFRTHDERYLIKIVSKSEANTLRRILRDYYTAVTSPGTLLSPYLALFKIQRIVFRGIIGFSPKYFLLFPYLAPNAVIYFDVKGCLLHRNTPVEESQVLKDVDLIESQTHLFLASDVRSEILARLKTDVEFLRTQNIIDYSLLLAISFVDDGRREEEMQWRESRQRNSLGAEERRSSRQFTVPSPKKTVAIEVHQHEQETAQGQNSEKISPRHKTKDQVEETEERIERDGKKKKLERDGEKTERRESDGVKIERIGTESEDRRKEEQVVRNGINQLYPSPSVPVHLSINSYIHSRISTRHPVLKDLHDVVPGFLRLDLRLIDYLTTFRAYHHFVRVVKRVRYGPRITMSTTNPDDYARRLQSYAGEMIA